MKQGIKIEKVDFHSVPEAKEDSPAKKELTEQEKAEQFDTALKGFLSGIDPDEKSFWKEKGHTPERSVAFQSALLNLVAIAKFWPRKMDSEVMKNIETDTMNRLPLLRREAFFQIGKPGVAEIDLPLIVDQIQKEIRNRILEAKTGKQILTVYGDKISRLTH